MRYSFEYLLFIALGAAAGCRPNTASDSVDRPAQMAVRKDKLATPMQIHIQLDGKPVGDVIYPFLGDIDGDGTPDLMIGTRLKGRLLVYPNIRTAVDYILATPQWFDDREPTGRIPSG